MTEKPRHVFRNGPGLIKQTQKGKVSFDDQHSKHVLSLKIICLESPLPSLLLLMPPVLAVSAAPATAGWRSHFCFPCRLVAKEDYNIAAISNNNNEDHSSASRFVSVSFQLHLCFSSSLLSSPLLLPLFYHIPFLSHSHFHSSCTLTHLLSLAHSHLPFIVSVYLISVNFIPTCRDCANRRMISILHFESIKHLSPLE